jgi:hypothetical protein
MNVINQSLAKPLISLSFVLLGLLILASAYLGIFPIFAGLCFFVFLVASAFIRPERMFIVTIFVSILIPLDFGIKAGYLFRIGPTRVVLAAFLIGWLSRCVIVRNGGLSRLNLPLLGVASLYVLSGIFSSFFSVAPLISFYGVLGRDILEQFILFYCFVNFLRKPEFWTHLKFALFLGTAVVCIFGLYEFATHNNPFLGVFEGTNLEFREGILRIRSTFFHPIALGSFLNLIFPFVLVELAGNKDRLQRSLYSLLILLVLVASFLTMSRVPWACLIFEIVILFVWWGSRKLRSVAIGMSVVAIFSMGLFMAYEKIGLFNRMFRPLVAPQEQEEMSSEYYRVALIKAVVDHLSGERWIYGYGPNAFYLAGVEAHFEGRNKLLTSPDNHYVRVLLEYGAVGAFLFCILIIIAVDRCIQTVRIVEQKQKMVGIACIASVLGFLVANASASLFQMYPLGMLFWMCVAVSLTLSKKE